MDVRSVFSQHPLVRTSDGQTLPPLESCDQITPILMLVWPQLGDFDTLEYAWWVQRERAKLTALNIQVRAVGIGDRTAAQKFCAFTGFPSEHLFVDPTAQLHEALNLYKGLSANLPGLNPQQTGYLNLLLMCAGIGSPGTLREVFRGYKGDKSAPQLIADEEEVKAAPLPALKGEVFKAAGGKGFQRPFELATLRLRNMGEVLSHWKTYVPDAAYLTQRGGTFLFDEGGALVYEWRDRNILGFAENMSNPLSFLEQLSTSKHHDQEL
ncbi:MAG: peroxiredoxin-like family protein [Cyanobacteria bacterium J06627_28]